MYNLLGMSSPNVNKIVIMLEELGVNWTFQRVDVLKGEQFGDDFKALNLNSKVPVLQHLAEEGEPYNVFESGAILQYLAEVHHKFLPAEMGRRFDVLQWLTFQVASIGPMFGQHVHFTRFAPIDSLYAAQRYRAEVERLWAVVEGRLDRSPYLGGSEYSIADIATYPWVSHFNGGMIKSGSSPNINRWQATIAERPAVRSAQMKITEIGSEDAKSMATATASDLDRLFNRGGS